MSEPMTVRMGSLVAYLSFALALSAQGGAVIWWAGTQNTRLISLEERVAELLSNSPIYHRQIMNADRRIAVIDERIANILARMETLTAALEHRCDVP